MMPTTTTSGSRPDASPAAHDQARHRVTPAAGHTPPTRSGRDEGRRALGCPSWCELEPAQHEPAWHAGALRIDHQRVHRVAGGGCVVVFQEASYTPADGEALTLTRGPVGASVEAAGDTLTASALRALAAAMVAAAELVEALTEADRMDASAVSPSACCNGWHTFTLGRCARCRIVAPGVVEAAGR